MKYLIGFMYGVILMCFIFVYVIQEIHINAEKQADVKWCIWTDTAITEAFGKPVREFFYITFKIFDYPLRSFYIYKDLNNEIGFYPTTNSLKSAEKK